MRPDEYTLYRKRVISFTAYDYKWYYVDMGMDIETAPMRYVALLRGINVGGRNIIAKDDLRGCFEDFGCVNVRTYIQSGNIVFRSGESNIEGLTSLIERELSERFSYAAQSVVLSYDDYVATVRAAPDGWGTDDEQKHNAMFILRGTTPEEILATLAPPKPDIETVTVGPMVIFWSIAKRFQTKTTMMRLPTKPAYRQMTIRNHNTVFRLLTLFDSI